MACKVPGLMNCVLLSSFVVCSLSFLKSLFGISLSFLSVLDHLIISYLLVLFAMFFQYYKKSLLGIVHYCPHQWRGHF